MGLLRSPNIKYQVNFCAKCDKQIDNSANDKKCDSCAKFFHILCTSDKQPSNEIIWQCEECCNNRSICTEKDNFEIRSRKQASPQKSPKHDELPSQITPQKKRKNETEGSKLP